MPLAVRNQGTAPLTLFDASVDHSAFTVAPSRVRVEPGKTATFTLGFTPPSAEKAVGVLQFSTDDPANSIRRGYLVGNQPGLGLGKPLPEIAASLVDGGRWSSTALTGRVALLAYFATF